MLSFLKRLSKRVSTLLPVSLRRALRRRYYLRIVKNYRESDWEWSPYIKPLVPSGSLIIDVGANVGYLSGLFAQWMGASGRVLSVEPIPATYDALSYSMRKLFSSSVTTIQSCVSDREGEVAMHVPEYAEGGANYYESRIVDANASAASNPITVPATTLDALIGARNPAFIKIDVEGHELAVIKGGAEFLSKHHPPLLIEVAGDPDEKDSNAAELFGLLESFGYMPHVIKCGRLELWTAGDKAVDYLFVLAGCEKK